MLITFFFKSLVSYILFVAMMVTMHIYLGSMTFGYTIACATFWGGLTHFLGIESGFHLTYLCDSSGDPLHAFKACDLLMSTEHQIQVLFLKFEFCQDCIWWLYLPNSTSGRYIHGSLLQFDTVSSFIVLILLFYFLIYLCYFKFLYNKIPK